jgi:hypothetical protein
LEGVGKGVVGMLAVALSTNKLFAELHGT